MKKILKLLPDTVLRVFDTLFCFKNVVGLVSRALDVELLQIGCRKFKSSISRYIFNNYYGYVTLIKLGSFICILVLSQMNGFRFNLEAAVLYESTSRRLWGPWLGAV